MIRRPVVAGSFYTGTKSILERELNQYITITQSKKKVIGLVAPHAGYIFSGHCAGKGYGMIQIPQTVIILGVNHHGFGHPYAIDGNDSWNTPLGDIDIDIELRDKLIKESEIFGIDSAAGNREHSLEVQVPFIQFLNPQAKILPITISSLNIHELITGGKEIASAIKGNNDVLIVASTDMSHYISAERAKDKDKKAIDKIIERDPQGLFNTVARERISMCGVSPTAMMLAAANQLGASQAQIIDYTNSGVVSGDFQQVVAYLSAIIF